MKIIKVLLIFLSISQLGIAQASYSFGILKYNGGGDWYANPTAVPNLIQFCNAELKTQFKPEPAVVEVGSPELFNYPILHMTGHGNVIFSSAEAENLRNYLLSGGFLHIDDNYGMDAFLRPEFKKVFPNLDFVELPYSHPIYNQQFKFPTGLPKVHEHDGKPAQGLALIHEGRVMVFYTYETDLGDGWEDPAVHKDPEVIRQKALQMGANIVQYAFTHGML